jgi:hypothetical protein
MSIRKAESAEIAQALADHAEYVALCEARGLTPMPLGIDWSMVCVMWVLGPAVIPYVSPTGSVWVRDLRHKTGRKDRPLAVATMGALKL